MVIESFFPVGSLIPKAETGVLNFLQKYPDYNGNDVTIAIFDSGVDPKAAGLEVSPIHSYSFWGCCPCILTTTQKAMQYLQCHSQFTKYIQICCSI